MAKMENSPWDAARERGRITAVRNEWAGIHSDGRKEGARNFRPAMASKLKYVRERGIAYRENGEQNAYEKSANSPRGEYLMSNECR